MAELPPLFAPGQRLGRFELVQRLAVGGMAEVYLAYATGPGNFRKVVAIKRLLPQHVLDPQLLRMFLDEARLMAQLSHPNVPQVTEVDDGVGVEVPYFVMEYIHGTDLRGVLNAAAGPLPVEHALAIATAVAAGLHHAHEQRGSGGRSLEIVHRDVSPSNILISFDGSVKVTDFGVAKWTEQRSFTHQGQLKGKFAHMSPEQCRGEALDRRSDVFALGTLLFEMTTGQPPFVAESDYDLLTQIVSRDAPAPSWPDRAYPTDLAAIVGRSLGRSRDDRYASAQELQLDLEAFGRAHAMVVSPLALAHYLESLFGARVTEWRQALKSGQTLADQLVLERRPVDAGSPAGPAARDRTQTDSFGSTRGGAFSEGATDLSGQRAVAARVPGAAEARPSWSATQVGNGHASTNAAETGGAAGAAGVTGVDRTLSPRGVLTRILAISVGAALAVTLLLVTTELTSRSERASSSAALTSGAAVLPPVAPSRTVLAPPPPAVAATASAPGRSPDSRDGDAALPHAETRGTAAATPPLTALARRGHAAVTARQSRRIPIVAPAPTAGAAAAAAGAGASDNAAAEPAPATSSDPPAPERPGSPPPPPVKVWDPDSPVPP